MCEGVHCPYSAQSLKRLVTSNRLSAVREIDNSNIPILVEVPLQYKTIRSNMARSAAPSKTEKRHNKEFMCVMKVSIH